MSRIVFYCCAVFFLGAFVYSKPYKATELINHENGDNQMIYSAETSGLQKREEHEINEEEPVIFDISTQVAKFILYFIKKYCKNNEKIDYLQNVLTKKGLGSIFKTNADGNFAYFENGKPENIKAKSNLIEQQGHAINYKLATVPNHELKISTIKTETKQKELIRGVELTTENIHVFNQYKTPRIHPEQQPAHYYDYIEEIKQPKYLNDKPKEILFKQAPEIIEYPLVKQKIIHRNNGPMIPEYLMPTLKNQQLNYQETPILEINNKHDVLEPMYEYASHGDEYGITEYEYPIPDYDYSIYPVVTTQINTQNNILPVRIDSKLSEPKIEHQTEISIIPELKTQSNIIDDWYKYVMPEVKQIKEQPEIINENNQFTIPENEPKIGRKDAQGSTTENIIDDKKEPEILDTLNKYIIPEKETLEPNHHEQPQFEIPIKDTKQPHNWFNYQQDIVQPEVQPDFKASVVEEHGYQIPDNYQIKVEPKIGVNQGPSQVQFVDQEQPDFTKPSIKEHIEYSMPHFEVNSETKQPDDWFNYQLKVEPKIEVNQGPSQVQFVNREQPDFTKPLIGGRVEYSMPHFNPETKQPDDWLNDKQEKIGSNQEPLIHFDSKQPEIIEFKETNPQIYFNQEHAFDFSKHEMKPTETNGWFKFQQDVPQFEGNSQIQFMNHAPNFKHPQIQEHTFDYTIPNGQSSDSWFKYSLPEYAEPNIESIDNTDITKYWLPDSRNNEMQFKIDNEDFPRISLENYADDVFRNYTIELEHLNEMKPYYKEIIASPMYGQFIDNINKMKDVLNVWKTGGYFYDGPNIEYVIKTMTKLSNDTLQLIQIDQTTSRIITTPSSTQQNTDSSGLRRTFDGSEALAKYLNDPKTKQEFGTLDLLLQNVILAYINLAKTGKTPDVKQGLLMLLYKIKFIMTRYKNLFSQLEWVDGEIENLMKNDKISINPEEINFFNNNFDLMFNNKIDFDVNSKLFLTLLNVPVTEKSKMALKYLIHQLLKDIVDISETDSEFKDVKFYLGEQKSIETSPLYHRLMEFVASPKDFLNREELTVKNMIEKNVETETEMSTTEIQELRIQPTPKKNIEKHHNIFREFLMNTDE